MKPLTATAAVLDRDGQKHGWGPCFPGAAYNSAESGTRGPHCHGVAPERAAEADSMDQVTVKAYPFARLISPLVADMGVG